MMVAQSFMTQVGTEKSTRIGASYSLSVGTSLTVDVGGKKLEETGADFVETVGGGRYFHVGKEMDFRCGASRLLLKSNGEIHLEGTHISLNAVRIDLN